jgi:membrane fusion protein (multidrug efflux system)
MALPFARSVRSLERDGYARSVLLVLTGAALLAGWGAWAGLGRVRLYETTARARLETVEPLHRIEAPISGRVLEVLVELGQAVEADQPLVRLESAAQRLELSEAEARLDALRAQIGPLEAELAVALEHASQSQATARSAVSEAAAQERAVRTAADLARDRSQRLERLAGGGAVSETQRLEAEADAVRSTSEAEAAGYAVRRMRWEQLVRHTDSRTRVEALRRELARVEGEVEAARAAVERLREALERRVVRAPRAGRVAEMETLSAGRVMESGAHLLSILPNGPLRVVAHFAPRQAFGRIRPGLPAQMRLDGFPWTQFGMLRARVERVADETREEGVRVELALLEPSAFPAPLDHGLPGSVEVEVEEVSPAELVLRAAGQWLRPSTAGSPTAPVAQAQPR